MNITSCTNFSHWSVLTVDTHSDHEDANSCLTPISLLDELWIVFCLTEPISLCVDSCVYAFFLHCIVLLHMCCIIVTRWGEPSKIEA